MSKVSGTVAGIGSQQQAIGTAGAGLAGSVGVDSSLQQQHVTFAVDSLDAKANVGSQQHQPIGNATERAAQYTRV
ncbi:MAG: hypothetical protein EXS16_13715 [Gemmataceae bacterium]|nr:hypothetical protein [Gemmataceae bacterium]